MTRRSTGAAPSSPPAQAERPAAAPLYTAAHDLALTLHRLSVVWRSPAARDMALPILARADALLCSLSCALALPHERAAALRDADIAVAGLRVLLPLARDLRLLAPDAALRLGESVAEIGRMLGGWQKRIAFLSQTPDDDPDRESATQGPDHRAPTASTAAAAGTTTPPGCARRTATGTRPGTGTTTSASGSPAPSPEPATDSRPEQVRSRRRGVEPRPTPPPRSA